MADADPPQTDAPAPSKKLNPKDLKARLGLKKKQPTFVPKAKPVEPELDEDTILEVAPGPAAGTAQAVEEARRRSEEAASQAGPAVEDFTMLGQENTPLPSTLPAADIEVAGAAADFPGRERQNRIKLIALAGVVGVLCFVFGNLMGSAGEQRSQRAEYIKEAQGKRKLLLEAKSANGLVIDRIKDLKAHLKSTIEQIDAAAGADKAPSVLDETFKKLIPVLSAYVADQVYVDPAGVLGDTVHNPVLTKEIVAYAARTQVLYEQVRAALEEAGTYVRIARPPRQPTRVVLLQEELREVEGKGQIPVGTGIWIQNTGAPDKVKMVDPRTGRALGEDWQQMVLPVGETEPMQVPTRNVMQLDLTQVYDEQAKQAKRISIDRLSQITRKLDDLVAGVNFDKLDVMIKEWSSKEP